MNYKQTPHTPLKEIAHFSPTGDVMDSTSLYSPAWPHIRNCSHLNTVHHIVHQTSNEKGLSSLGLVPPAAGCCGTTYMTS